LEDKRTEINLSLNNDNNLLKEMEDKTLKMLYMSEGNILDDEELIDALNNNKVNKHNVLYIILCYTIFYVNITLLSNFNFLGIINYRYWAFD